MRHLAICLPALALLAILMCASPARAEENPAMEGYVEATVPEACRVCHLELYRSFAKENPHWKSLSDPNARVDRQGCEACHGPAQKHINTGGNKEFIFSFTDPQNRDSSGVCLKCHGSHEPFFQFQRGAHRSGGIVCSDCHRMHGAPVKDRLLKTGETELCFSCHPEIKPKFSFPTRHKVLEGAMSCSDCHAPHGAPRQSSLRQWNAFNVDVCFQCHPEKRGPWVFEHPSVKIEGCGICHDPHGSPNRFLLSHRDVRRICIQCHGQRHQGDFLFSTEVCINCHTQIHGSNFSSRFFQ